MSVAYPSFLRYIALEILSMYWTSCPRAYVHTLTVRCGLVLKTLELEFRLTALQRDAFKSAPMVFDGGFPSA